MHDEAEPDALDNDTVPHDRFCDLVLTGGVTSGVAYPWAILELARSYRFQSIGGTSAGAMAAALAAAAEFQRRRGSVDGFKVLRGLPASLAAEQDDGTTQLFSLFQPTRRTRRLFTLAAEAFHPGPRWRTRMCRAVIAAYRVPMGLGVAAMLAVFLLLFPVLGGPGIVGALVGCAAAALLALPVAIYRDLVKGVARNNMGLCNGREIVDWLHQGIAAASGRRAEDAPLTFEELWQADPGFPPDWLSPPPDPPRAIDLRMVTTNVTHGRPIGLPLVDETIRLFFDPEELAPYFPPAVMKHLCDASVSVPYAPRSRSDPAAAPEGRTLLELPRGRLPVIVAARLSLSVPLLFSAVPLWAIDHEPERGQRALRRCWFTDGGICSNFPIHMFDSLLPQWPTFGIWLRRRNPFWQNQTVWMPQNHYEGRGDNWHRFDERPPLARLGGFVLAIADTARNWTDHTQARMPGVRDRVARVALRAGQGQFDLRMSSEQIMALAREYGTATGKALCSKFNETLAGSVPPGTAWNEHRWVRFNTLLAALRTGLRGFTASAGQKAHAQPLRDQILAATLGRPLRGDSALENSLSIPQADALEALLRALEDLEAAFAAEERVPQPYRAQPEADLALRPPL